MSFKPWHFIIVALAGWMNRQQQDVIAYLKVENGILREKLGRKRVLLNEQQKCRLAATAARLSKDVLRGVTDLFSPETLLKWNRWLIARKYDGSDRQGKRGPVPKKANMVRKLVLEMVEVSPRIIPSRPFHKDLRLVATGGSFCYQGRMNTVLNVFRNLRNGLGCVAELVGYLLRFVSAFFQSRASLAARLLAAESQLGICKRRIEQKAQPKPGFTAGFRLLWVVLSKMWAPWQAAAQLMQPATVKRWHTQAFRIYWRWKSRKKHGRPPVTREMQDLIRKLSRENPLWGAGQIRDNLLLLHYEPPCEDTIRKYMVKPKNPRDKSATWLPFLRNHLDVSWAIDFFTVTTIRFATVYVFLVFHHGRRKVVQLAITCNPSMRWVIQQLREAMPYDQQPRFLFLDNDGIYGDGVAEFLESCGIEEVRTAYRCPWQNPFVERFVGTLRRELLDHVIVLGQSHLERLLREFIEAYYYPARPHQGLDGDTPIPQPKAEAPITGPTRLISVPILGGLHHRYQRVAA